MRILAGLTTQRRVFAGIVAGALLLALAGVFVLFFPSQTTTAASEQPINFSHRAHAQNGIPCQHCHVGVNKGPAAGIPSVEMCMGCHLYVATDRTEIKKLAGYWERQEPIPWQRVNQQPSYVHFSHQPHIAAGVSCGSCHGDVANMTVAKSVVKMNMGFCLNCHAEQDNKDALYDCVVCHY